MWSWQFWESDIGFTLLIIGPFLVFFAGLLLYRSARRRQ